MSRPRLTERILAARVQRTMQGRERQRRTITRRDGVRYEVDGRWLTNFSGNDYLGLGQHFAVVDALQAAAGRETMSDELQALCFLAGANSIFYGEKLLTTGNPDTERDLALFERLGLKPMQVVDAGNTVHADIEACDLPVDGDAAHPRTCAA